ncbi:MAG: hypothetical protein MJ238_03440 [Bacilli bacterium]|nr:hypothetical protein [Bacilli bacterium]
MLNLIAKDFKLMFSKNGNRLSKVLSWVFTAIVSVLFIAIETYIFYTIIGKISVYDGASSSFFIVFLFIISLIMIGVATVAAKKVFFSEEDVQQLASFPISGAKKIISKLFFLAITMYFANLVFTLPLFFAYGLTMGKMMLFFYTSLYYPVLILVFELGVALILVYPYKLLMDYLKKHFIIQLVVVLVVSFGATIIYSQLLNVFIELVSTNTLTNLFTTSSIASVNKAANFLVPVNFLIDAIVNYQLSMVFPYLGISLGLLTIGLALTIYFYQYFTNFVVNDEVQVKEHSYKVVSVERALVKKELILLFRNSNYLFSFTGLLFIEPLLSYLVVKAINTIFSSGTIAYYAAVVPNLLPITDILLMLLFVSIISQGANNYISSEKKNIRFIKSIPVDLFTQIKIKVIIPASMSLTFAFISWVVLKATSTVSWVTFLFGTVMSLALVAIINLVSLFEELNIKRGKPRNSLMSSVYSYVFPFTYFLLGIVMAYFQVNIVLIYLVGFVVIALGAVPYLFNFKKRVSDLFLELEVIN